MYPNDPSRYRRVNKAMDKELVWYKEEIEKRFIKSECRDFVMPRPRADHDSYAIA